ncbi:MAG: COX15/CtaA family protein [Alsobacter sp.]
MSTTTSLGPEDAILSESAEAAGASRALRVWIGLLAALVMAMVVVGGATRLTGSGLSITEWRPVTGAVPPLSEPAWQAEFEKYRQSPQYQIQNAGMTLPEFKEIYWWEWSHRQLGRAIGVVFGVGFLLFAGAGALRGRVLLAVGGLGLLGGLQGAIGWIMVKSGLQPGMTAVAPLKLMLHLVTASLIFSGLIAVLVELRGARSAEFAPSGVRRGAAILLGIVLLQIALGALVAGSKAGLVYNTWPLIDGHVLPAWDQLVFVQPVVENLVDNHLTVQFNHRMVAYLLFALAFWHAWSTVREQASDKVRRRAMAVAGLVAAQAGVGIATLLAQVPLGLALLHQGVAMLVLAMATVHWRLTRKAEA